MFFFDTMFALWIISMPLAFALCCRIQYDQFQEIDLVLATLVGFSGPLGLVIGLLFKLSSCKPIPQRWRRLVLGKGRSNCNDGSTTILR